MLYPFVFLVAHRIRFVRNPSFRREVGDATHCRRKRQSSIPSCLQDKKYEGRLKTASLRILYRSFSGKNRFQHEVEHVVPIRHSVLRERQASPTVHASQSGLGAFDMDVRPSVGYEVAGMADVFGRSVVELRNGVGDCRS